MRSLTDTSTTARHPQRSWRRRLSSRLVPRVSLRIFFALLTILCVVLGLWVHRAERQRAACAELKRLNWSYYFQGVGQYDHKPPTWLSYFPKSLREGEALHYWLSIREVFPHDGNLAQGCRAVARLPSVQSLSFRYCSGPFDDEVCKIIGQAKNLRMLNLAKTTIDDAGLIHIANLPRLESLHLDGTRIGNKSLGALANLRRLQSLSLDETNIDDQGLQYLASMNQLRTLELRRTNITSAGIRHLSELTKLETLVLDGTEVDDLIESSIRQLPRLITFRADDTALSDASCSSMLHQSSLKSISLERTSVGRKTVASLSKLPNLEGLYLEGVSLAPGDICPLASARKLKWLDLPASVPLEDLLLFRGASALRNLNGSRAEEFRLNLLSDAPSTQTKVEVRSRSLGESGWSHIAKNTQITELKIDRCDLSIDALQRLTNLKNLTKLEISGCPITDASLDQIAKFTQLKSLQIEDGSFTEIGLSSLASLQRLETLNLWNCEGIPERALPIFANCSNLQKLSVDAVVKEDPSPQLSSILGTSHDPWKNLKSLRWGDDDLNEASMDVLLHRPIALDHKKLDWSLNEPFDSEQLALIAAAPHLTHLSIDGPALRDSDWERLGSLPNLVSIQLFRCRVDDKAFAWFAQLPELVHLEYYGHELTEANAQALSESRSLSRIDVVGTAPTAATLKWLSQLPQLTDIDLSHCEVDSSTFEAIVPGAARLESLNLSFNRITPKTLKTLLAGLPALKSLALVDCQLDRRAFDILTTHGGKLETLRVSGNDFRAEDFLSRLDAFPRLDFLQTNAMTPEAPSWKASTSKYQFAWIRWRSRNIDKPIHLVPDSLSDWCTDRRLHIDTPLIGDAFAIDLIHSNGEHDAIDACGAAVGASFLAELARRDQVIELDLSYTQITDEDLAHVAKLTRLRELNLAGCKITDAGVELIANNCWRLTKIDLSETQITNRALQDLAKLRFLKELDLNQTSITDEGLRPLRALKHLERIRINWDDYDWKEE